MPEHSGSESESASAEQGASKAIDLFDLRRIIGGLFAVYGVVLTLLGIFGTHVEKTKAAGININLWTGLGMIVFAAFMLTWAFTRPLSSQVAPEELTEAPPPATG
jgi:drug/metabolite transporter (DMT)-like permease